MPQCSWPQTLHIPPLSLLDPNLPTHFYISLTALFLAEFLLSVKMTTSSYYSAKDAQSALTFTNKMLRKQISDGFSNSPSWCYSLCLKCSPNTQVFKAWSPARALLRSSTEFKLPGAVLTQTKTAGKSRCIEPSEAVKQTKPFFFVR